MKRYINKTNIILISLLLISGILLLSNYIFDFQTPIEYNNGISDNTTKELKKGDIVEITTTSKVNNLEALQIEVSPAVDNANIQEILRPGDGFVSIYNEKNKLIFYSELQKITFFDNHELYLKFDKIKDSNNKKFRIIIEINENLDHKLFKLKKTIENSEFDSAKINGKDLKDDISIVQYGTAKTEFYRVLFMTLIFILFFIFCRYNLKNNEVLKRYLVKNKKIFVLEFICSLIASFSYLIFKYYSYYLGKTNFICYGAFAVATLIIIAILATFLGDRKLKREDLFLLIGIPISILFLVFILPLNVPDEFYHYKVSTKISMFQIFNQNIMIPSNLEEYNLYTLFNNNVSYDNLIPAESGGYHPILYAFSGFGLWLSKLLQLSPIAGLYMGRSANLILYLIVGYYIVKKIPMAKFLMIIYLLNPMFLQQAASFSADALINIFSMLFISYVLYIRYEKKNIETKDFIILLTSYMVVFAGKYAYFLLVLLFILIWKELKDYILEHKKQAIIITLIIVIIGVCWLVYTNIPKEQIVENIKSETPQSTESKLLHILKNPTYILPIYFNTLLTKFDSYLTTFLGAYLGPLTIAITPVYTIIYAIILVLAVFMDKEKHELDKKSKIINIIIFILTFHIILAGLYLGWGVITDTIIQGVQGRYFIPIVILLLLAMVRKKNIALTKMELPILIVLLVTNVLIIRDVILQFLI